VYYIIYCILLLLLYYYCKYYSIIVIEYIHLGFLKSNGGDIPASNFGLLDQMAALEWIKNNIQAFGGNPNAVTVMGHGTGAACANFLMMAPPVNNNSKYLPRTYTVNK
jgi:hypothetical protein